MRETEIGRLRSHVPHPLGVKPAALGCALTRTEPTAFLV